MSTVTGLSRIQAGLALTCLLLTGCAKGRLYDQIEADNARWFRAAWDSELDAAGRAAERDRLDCMWDGLEAEGIDPEPDFECHARRIARAADCYERRGEPEQCAGVLETTCTVTSTFESLATTRCRPPRH